MKEKPNSHNTSLNLVLKCGVPPCLSGYIYLAEAVEMHAEGTSSFMEIYRRIADKLGIKPKSVLRDISYAISQSYGIAEKLSDILGIEIPNDQIHNGLIISYLACKLNQIINDHS